MKTQISITLDDETLKSVDKLRKSAGFNRSQFIEWALRNATKVIRESDDIFQGAFKEAIETVRKKRGAKSS